jgi:hypothetical protein
MEVVNKSSTLQLCPVKTLSREEGSFSLMHQCYHCSATAKGSISLTQVMFQTDVFYYPWNLDGTLMVFLTLFLGG